MLGCKTLSPKRSFGLQNPELVSNSSFFLPQLANVAQFLPTPATHKKKNGHQKKKGPKKLHALSLACQKGASVLASSCDLSFGFAQHAPPIPPQSCSLEEWDKILFKKEDSVNRDLKVEELMTLMKAQGKTLGTGVNAPWSRHGRDKCLSSRLLPHYHYT